MLHALKEYAEAMGLESEPGFKPKEIKWLLVFNNKGQYINVQRLGDGKSGELFSKCPHLTQPELKGGGGGCRHFLVDGLDVVSLLTAKGEPDEKQLAKHAYFLRLLDQAGESDPRLNSISSGLSDSVQIERIRNDLSGFKPKAKPADLATFAAVASDEATADSVIVNDNSWHDWWRQFRQQLGSAKKRKASNSEKRLCFLTGETVEPASTHPPITGLASVGGMAMGDIYASFKQESFQSYGLSQSSNAALSEDAAKLYTTALNDLIRERSIRLAGSRIAYWYVGKKNVPAELDPVRNVIDGFDLSQFQTTASGDSSTSEADDVRLRAQSELAARSLLSSIRNLGREDLLEAEFRAVTMSANSGRIVVRDWMEGQFQDFASNVDSWFNDLRIVRREGSGIARDPKFLAVLSATVRDLKDITSPSEVAMWRAAVRGSPIPHYLAANALTRFRIDLIQDRPASHAQVGLLKAFCARQLQQGNPNMPQLTTELNETTDHPAYVAGRILALLGQIQKKAIPGVSVGVVERYYAAASTSPALILGRLIRTALIAHLPKIKPDELQAWFDSQLASLVAILNESPKRTLTMEEQTLFALGYYQQKAKRHSGDKSQSDS